MQRRVVRCENLDAVDPPRRGDPAIAQPAQPCGAAGSADRALEREGRGHGQPCGIVERAGVNQMAE
ncbi:hypothetical protein FHY05_004329 [Sphingomonas sp. BK580]|nr:hypothetical protein [Sphingomonas sp. BK580]